jgi:hypothetical protein
VKSGTKINKMCLMQTFSGKIFQEIILKEDKFRKLLGILGLGAHG